MLQVEKKTSNKIQKTNFKQISKNCNHQSAVDIVIIRRIIDILI
jgi:hypothetical protein